jgi:hypothetical protein
MLGAYSCSTLTLIAAAVAGGFGDEPFDRVAAPFLASYCVKCHAGANAQGGLDLAPVQGDADVRAARDDWDWLRERVALREMPPRGEAQPTDAERAAFDAWLAPLLAIDMAEVDSGASNVARDAASASPGRPVMRRLTRRVYENAVRDLFGVTFDARGTFPDDPIGYGFEGVGEAQTLAPREVELFLDAATEVAARAILVDPPADAGGAARARRLAAGSMDGPGASHGDVWHMHVNGAVGGAVPLPRDGRYRVRARLHGDQAGDEPVRVTLQLGGAESERFDVPEGPDAPRTIEFELDVSDVRVGGQGTRVAVHFVNDYWNPAEPDAARRDRNLAVHWIEVVGPLDPTPRTPFLTQLEAAAEGERGRGKLRAALATMVRRVWRRPADERELGRLERLTPSSAPFAERLQVALTALLASPNFIYLVEGAPPVEAESVAVQPGDTQPGARRLTDCELAARLAFVLWASVPDVELDALADAGRLAEPAVLLAEVDRMLADERSDALLDTFALPWLHLGPLAAWTADETLFPEFDKELRRSMLGETRRVLRRHLREERPLVELLDGPQTFVDERLARHYGVPYDAARGRWQEADVAAVGRRGLLGHASVLTVTSEPTRTSPVKRGKWVLEVLLGSPPPPPPPGVDSLDSGPGADASLSLRERLALHRTDPNCATCHTRMDPLGFGLEAFDAIGRARAVEAADVTASLPDGRSFAGAEELVALLRDEGVFARQVAERLSVYALGRPLGRADRAHLAEVLASAGGTPTLRGLVRAVIASRAFGWVDVVPASK